MKFCILGSCVSRDAFDLVAHEHALTGFISRQSLACAFQGLSFPLGIGDLDPEGTLPDKYPRRMLELNLSGDLRTYLMAATEGADAILVDFIDERHSLIEREGRLATYCNSLRSLVDADASTLLGPLDARRVDLFAAGAYALKTIADDLGLPVLLHKATWAHGSKGHNGADRKFVDANNEMLATYFSVAARLGFIPLEPGSAAPRPDPGHRWGDAPYHYTTQTYAQLISELDRWSHERGYS